MRIILLLILIAFNAVCFAQQSVTHRVKKGDTFFGLANQYNVKVADIYKLNPKLKNSSLQINQKVAIPQLVKVNKKELDLPTTHIVGRGDTFFKIAKKYNINVVDITSYNKNLESSNLKIGEIIYLKEVGMKEIATQITPEDIAIDENVELTHVVLSKETKYGISKKYGMSISELERLNPNIVASLDVGITLIIKPTSGETVAVIPVEEENDIAIDDVFEPLNASQYEKANFLIDRSSSFIGTRYRSGGTSPNGFDCSGLMCTTFKEIEVNLPRTSRDQSQTGKKVKRKQAQIGDLIFFSTNGRGNINHVGMITEVNDGEIKFIHSSSSAGVIISSLNENYYSKRFKQINRVLL